MSKKNLSEADICAKHITPAVVQAGWDETTQIRREVGFTRGRIIVRGKLVTRGKAKRADYVVLARAFAQLAGMFQSGAPSGRGGQRRGGVQ